MCIIGNVIILYYSKLSLFTDSILWFSVSRFFVFRYLADVLGTDQRAKAIAVINLMFYFALVFISLVALVVMKNYGWKVFVLLTILPSIPLAPAFL